MIQPEELKKNERLLWSTGKGTEVWELFCACITGDLGAVKRLVAGDPTITRSSFAYRTPIYFAVRENQLEVARFLLEHGADPLSFAVNDSLLDICRDRGYSEMEKLLEASLAGKYGASSRGEPIAAAIRERELAKVRSLLDTSPELLKAGDTGSNQPIHWAVMTRQLDMIDELLARGADIDAPRFDGARPIQLTNGDYYYRGWRDVPKEIVDLLKDFEETGALPAESLERYTALAQDMVDAYVSGDGAALQRISGYYQPPRRSNADQFREGVRERLGRSSKEVKDDDSLALEEAQLLVARSHGFGSWAQLVKSVEG